MTIPTPLFVLLSAALAALPATAGAQQTYRDGAGSEREGYCPVGLLATCPSMPGLVAGVQRSGPTQDALRIGGGLSIAPLNRRIAAAVRGVAARKR